MAWDFFRKKPTPGADTARWWQDANACALQPDMAGIATLQGRLAPASELDEHERQVEMIEGLQFLIAQTDDEAQLPLLATQHRVIGSDACHFMAPVSAPDHGDAIGKLFLTSHRVIFAGGASIAWPWHRVRRVARHERDVIFESGDTLSLRLRCNNYGDALRSWQMSQRLLKK